MDESDQITAPSDASLPTIYVRANAAAVLTLRLKDSEATDLVTKLLDTYAAPDNVPAYIGAIVDVLLEFPRVVALKCMSPVHGIAREWTGYLPPTAGAVTQFCERERKWWVKLAANQAYYQTVRVRSPQPAIDDDERARVAAGLKALANELRERAEAARPKGISSEKAEATNRYFFERDCLIAGIDPATRTGEWAVSPSLEKLVNQQVALAQAIVDAAAKRERDGVHPPEPL